MYEKLENILTSKKAVLKRINYINMDSMDRSVTKPNLPYITSSKKYPNETGRDN